MACTHAIRNGSTTEDALDRRIEAYARAASEREASTWFVWICMWTVDMLVDELPIMSTLGPQRRSVAELEVMGAACMLERCPALLGLNHPYHGGKHAALAKASSTSPDRCHECTFDCLAESFGNRVVLDTLNERATAIYGDSEPMTALPLCEFVIMHVIDGRF